MIKHIPHSSTYIPYECKCFIGEPKDFSDIGVIPVFGVTNALVFPMNRLVCDVERFIENEPMEEKGMGICYTNNADLEPMRIVSEEERNYIIEKYYKPHHKRLELMVEEELRKYGEAVIIDCHTYRKEPWKYEDETLARPAVCIGYDEESWVSTYVETFLSYRIKDIGINTPFSGAIKPLKYIKDKNVHSVMIEVRQDCVSSDMAMIIQEMLHNISSIQQSKRQDYVSA